MCHLWHISAWWPDSDFCNGQGLSRSSIQQEEEAGASYTSDSWDGLDARTEGLWRSFRIPDSCCGALMFLSVCMLQVCRLHESLAALMLESHSWRARRPSTRQPPTRKGRQPSFLCLHLEKGSMMGDGEKFGWQLASIGISTPSRVTLSSLRKSDDEFWTANHRVNQHLSSGRGILDYNMPNKLWKLVSEVSWFI